MSVKKVLITAGGTGGHLYPAQALAQEIKKKSPQSEVLFVAGGLATNRYFDRDSFSFHQVSCTPLFSANPLKCLKGLVNLCKGVRQSIVHLKQFKPDVVVGFGSYYTVAPLLAAKRLNIPIILHEANSVPGKANLWLASLADYVALHFPGSSNYFKGKTIHVGLPLREGYHYSSLSKKEAVAHYGFSEGKKTILICGGSQGARAINLLIKKSLHSFPDRSIQIIHLTGNVELQADLAAAYAAQQIEACVKVFEQEMQFAWKAADFFIGRAGASTIAEAMEFEVPGILIPYPFATENHQKKNADFFAHAIGGGEILVEANLTEEKFLNVLLEFLKPEKLASMQHALKEYKERPQKVTLFELITHLTQKSLI